MEAASSPYTPNPIQAKRGIPTRRLANHASPMIARNRTMSMATSRLNGVKAFTAEAAQLRGNHRQELFVIIPQAVFKRKQSLKKQSQGN
jgi:hypothetical protein